VYPAGTGRVRVEALQPGDGATGTTVAAASPAAPAPTALDVATRDYRYPVRTADGQSNPQGFEDWMQQRGVRVATGRPTLLASNDAQAPVSAPLPAPAVTTTVASPAEAALAAVAKVTTAGTAPGPTVPADAVTLQIASFSARANADRALATLRGAGIAGARLLDAVANGQPIWRLRVGPVPATTEAELAGRLRGLGFASPQRVRD
jgi:rare lipoprotein A